MSDHQVIPLMATTTVTQAQWTAVMGTTLAHQRDNWVRHFRCKMAQRHFPRSITCVE